VGITLTMSKISPVVLLVVSGLGAAPATVMSQDRPANTELEVSGLGYFLGDPDAPIHVVEFADLGCRECRRFSEETFPSIQEEYVSTGRVYWQVIPYVSGLQPNGEQGARAAECAANQDDFWPMHDALYSRQTEWWTKRRPQRQFKRYAEALDLDTDRFGRCYREKETEERTAANTKAALRAGVRATPTFFVNGRMVLGALPVDLFRTVLEQAVVPAG
jgi:protein-disulfide isomerase